MKKRLGHPAWFKLFGQRCAVFDAAGNEATGKAIRAALHLMNTGELIELDPLSAAVFAVLKDDVDAAIDSYKSASEAGKAGNKKRWEKDNPPPSNDEKVSEPDTSRYDPNQKYRDGIEGLEGQEGLEGLEGQEGIEGIPKGNQILKPTNYDADAVAFEKKRAERMAMLEI